MSIRTLVTLATASALTFGPLANAGLLDEQLTASNVITGKMTIIFGDSEASDYADQLDQYIIKKDTSIRVGSLLMINGDIKRNPYQAGKEGHIEYLLNVDITNPNNVSQMKPGGTMQGAVPIDINGKYIMKGADNAPFQIKSVGAKTVGGSFAGKLIGKQLKKKGLLEKAKEKIAGVAKSAGESIGGVAREYTRKLGNGKEIKLSVANADPMGFENLVLAQGPMPGLPEVTVNGNLDFDYASSNWLTNGITMDYVVGTTKQSDKITGSIRWVENDNGATKVEGDIKYTGYYELNLRFNEDAVAAASSGDDFFDASGMSEEDAFFAQDDSVPSITGRVYYNDNDSGSEVTYALNGNKVNRIQLSNFMKLWLIGVGPLNDD